LQFQFFVQNYGTVVTLFIASLLCTKRDTFTKFAACHSRIFDTDLVIPLDRLVFIFFGTNTTDILFCLLWFTEHSLQRTLYHLSNLITFIIPVTVAGSKGSEM
jgi:hypothetical protein